MRENARLTSSFDKLNRADGPPQNVSSYNFENLFFFRTNGTCEKNDLNGISKRMCEMGNVTNRNRSGRLKLLRIINRVLMSRYIRI